MASFWCLFAVSAPVRAQDDAARTARARSFFEQGLRFVEQDRWEDAADRFQRAYALRPTSPIAYNLGAVWVRMGRLVEASEMLRHVERDQSAAATLRAQARQQLEQVRGRIGQLTIRVRGETSGADITMDDRALDEAAIGVAGPADPGHHVLAARRGGSEVARAEVDVPEGGAAEVEIEVPAAEVASASEAARESVTTSSNGGAMSSGALEDDDEGGSVFGEWWFWGLAVVLIAGGVTAAVLITSQGDDDPVLPGPFEPGTITWN